MVTQEYLNSLHGMTNEELKAEQIRQNNLYLQAIGFGPRSFHLQRRDMAEMLYNDRTTATTQDGSEANLFDDPYPQDPMDPQNRGD